MWWMIPMIASAAGGLMSQMGSNDMMAQRQRAGQQAMAAQLANQQQFRDQALGETIKMSDTYGDLPTEEQDASDQLYAKSKPQNIGDEDAQSRVADLKATKASRASADVRGRGLAHQAQGTELQELAMPLSTLVADARRDWALTPARMQSEMNKVDTPFMMTLGNLLQTGGQLGSLGMGFYNGMGGGGQPDMLTEQGKGIVGKYWNFG